MVTGRVVVDHVLFVVADLDASRRLYTAALAPLGYEERVDAVLRSLLRGVRKRPA
jgi:catechol 2,3-dioxygenase-like lactoylglutathione lyase family enzyme